MKPFSDMAKRGQKSSRRESQDRSCYLLSRSLYLTVLTLQPARENLKRKRTYKAQNTLQTIYAINIKQTNIFYLQQTNVIYCYTYLKVYTERILL